jgi:hypothetical protein
MPSRRVAREQQQIVLSMSSNESQPTDQEKLFIVITCLAASF